MGFESSATPECLAEEVVWLEMNEPQQTMGLSLEAK